MRVRLFALLSAAVLFVLTAPPVSAGNEGHGYLALGDSVAFGFNWQLIARGLAGNPNVFVGYPEIVARTLGTEEVNASCPGETTGGFISLTNGADFKCHAYRSAFPLHADYSTSQLDFAIAYLSKHPEVKLVTMDIGANDVFKLQTGCGGVATVCFVNGLPGVLANIDANLRFIYGQIRNVAHYHHLLVTLTYYSLSYDRTTAEGTKTLNNPIIDATLAFGGIMADGFAAFQGPAVAAGGSSCAAGLLLPPAPRDPSPCDVHPSALGRALLAGAVIKAIAESCPAQSVEGCLNRSQA